jgi:hypothetical protein
MPYPSNIAFGYRIVAKSAGAETMRLPEVTIPASVEVPREAGEPARPLVPERADQLAEPGESAEAPQPPELEQNIPQGAQP